MSGGGQVWVCGWVLVCRQVPMHVCGCGCVGRCWCVSGCLWVWMGVGV